MGRLLVISHVGVAGTRGEWKGKNRVGEVVEDLADRGWDVSFVARRCPPRAFLTHRFSRRVRIVPLVRGGALVREVCRADAALVFGPSLLSYSLAMVLGRRAVLYAGNAWALQHGYVAWRRRLERIAAGRVGEMVAAGDAVAAHFSKWTDARPCVPLVPAEVSARLLERVEVEKQDGLRVLFVGSLTAAKGAPAVIEAARRLPNVDVRLVGASAGPDGATLRNHGRELPNVSVHEYLDWEELREAYRWANVLALPSAVEGFPRVAYEAAAFGLALVLSPVGGVPSRLEHRRSALFVRPNDADGLTRALAELRERPKLREELAVAAVESLASVFVYPSAADQLDELLRRVTRDAPVVAAGALVR